MFSYLSFIWNKEHYSLPFSIRITCGGHGLNFGNAQTGEHKKKKKVLVWLKSCAASEHLC
uniref:Uncharacterized protein n=1 Tax=Anguilla anguilla TaxID=7936 RepID=A0A0E9PL31_ANGAN